MGNGIPAGYIKKPLNVITDRFAFPLHGGEEFVHGYLGIVLIETRKESGFQELTEPGGRL